MIKFLQTVAKKREGTSLFPDVTKNDILEGDYPKHSYRPTFATEKLGITDYFPGAGSPINVGQASGQTTGSQPIFAPTGQLIPYEILNARQRALEEASELAVTRGKESTQKWKDLYEETAIEYQAQYNSSVDNFINRWWAASGGNIDRAMANPDFTKEYARLKEMKQYGLKLHDEAYKVLSNEDEMFYSSGAIQKATDVASGRLDLSQIKAGQVLEELRGYTALGDVFEDPYIKGIKGDIKTYVEGLRAGDPSTLRMAYHTLYNKFETTHYPDEVKEAATEYVIANYKGLYPAHKSPEYIKKTLDEYFRDIMKQEVNNARTSPYPKAEKQGKSPTIQESIGKDVKDNYEAMVSKLVGMWNMVSPTTKTLTDAQLEEFVATMAGDKIQGRLDYTNEGEVTDVKNMSKADRGERGIFARLAGFEGATEEVVTLPVGTKVKTFESVGSKLTVVPGTLKYAPKVKVTEVLFTFGGNGRPYTVNEIKENRNLLTEGKPYARIIYILDEQRRKEKITTEDILTEINIVKIAGGGTEINETDAKDIFMVDIELNDLSAAQLSTTLGTTLHNFYYKANPKEKEGNPDGY